MGFLLPWWAKPVAAVLLIAVATVFIYHKGYNSAAAAWSVKYNTRENELIRASMAEADRQKQANEAAKRLEAERIAQLEADNQKLSQLIKELSDEADKDPAADSIVLSPSARMRINRVR